MYISQYNWLYFDQINAVLVSIKYLHKIHAHQTFEQ